jgi:mRNA-degrading endonuclease toxin of MazEF toxin-antitoxin module
MNRQKYIDLVDSNKTNNTCNRVIAKNIPDFVTDSVDTAYSLLVHIGDNYDQCLASEWLLGFDMYVNDLKGNFVGDFKNAYLGRGRIIEFDAFGDIGTEQKKKRPAIVLLENGNKGVIIAPIGKAAYNSGKHYHVSLERGKPDQGNMKYNCGIKLEQIRYIDKSRITDKFGKVTNKDKLNELDRKLVRNMAQHFYDDYERLKAENEYLNIEMVKMSKELSDKDDEIVKLQRRLQIVEQELLQYQMQSKSDDIS